MKAIIIDDEKEARDALRDTLYNYCPTIEVMGFATNGREGLNLIQEHNPDIVFLDVEMPDLSGFDVLNSLERIHFALIFVTAYNEYAVRAFEFSAIDYLLKPIDPPRLIEAIEKVRERQRLFQLEEQYKLLSDIIQAKRPPLLNNRITFSTQEEIIFVTLKDLIRIEADQNFSSVYVLGLPKRILIAHHLKYYERLFADLPFFFRVHRGHIVNLFYVRKFIREDGGYLLVRDQQSQEYHKIPVANRQREELLKRLSIL
ncbi:MAG: response regulator [Saprospiraceae bacterium]|nr:response regulator [Saprospiraceae bacterium]